MDHGPSREVPADLVEILVAGGSSQALDVLGDDRAP